jgi:hypothetical protein
MKQWLARHVPVPPFNPELPYSAANVPPHGEQVRYFEQAIAEGRNLEPLPIKKGPFGPLFEQEAIDTRADLAAVHPDLVVEDMKPGRPRCRRGHKKRDPCY